ncbi:sulfurtransferase [Falsigemmobacter intermedius]|uniref:Sulfurtransferase n=1 Tax=Falsigemmobacter intermedius TaxID=1553448 RepID=A0A3S3WL00_9RHOB|nr:rhodanese-like domain-containing protein [Falsigemmobacter intermedius]RWY40103.1 sulfurtransferase [Falsigemmobacter intermedius]
MSALVEVDWLVAHKDQVVLLDASVTRIDRGTGLTEFAPGPEGFAKGHIPGARFADLMQDFSDPSARFSFTAPSVAQLQAAARAVGINDDSHVVIYDSLGGAYAARLWYLLRGHGLRQVSVLNGGLQAWEAAGHPLESGMGTEAAPGTFTARPAEGLFVGADEVMAQVSQGADPARPLLCALRPEQYRGEGSSDPRRGHIPTSLNLPYPALLGADGRLDPQALPQKLADLGLSRDIRPVLYCGGGINAAGLALAFHLIGQDDVTIYDDSMSGWRADPALPVEAGA